MYPTAKDIDLRLDSLRETITMYEASLTGF